MVGDTIVRMTQPIAPSPNQNPETWDATAPGYAQDVRQWDGFAREALRLVPVDASSEIVDIATGPGTLTLLAAGAARRVTAVDFSRGMIAQLEAKAAALGLTNIETGVMNAEALALEDARFDAAYCLFAYMFFPDRAKAFRELHRVVKPGGRAIIATWSPIERRPMMQLGFEAMAYALPSMPKLAKGDLQEPSECEAEMTAGGFRDVVAQRFVSTMRVESPEDYVATMSRSAAPLVSMKAKLGDAVWADIESKMVEYLRGHIPATGADLAAEAILTTGVA